MSYWYRTELDATVKRPLLLYLHGYGEIDGDHVAQTTKHGPWGEHVNNRRVAEELRSFFRVGPHLIGGDKAYWNPGMLRDLIRQIHTQHAEVATDHLFVVGISRGGQGALDFVIAHGQELQVRGVVVCCPQNINNLNAALESTPVYLFHGDGDTVVRLDATRERVYEDLGDKTNFRWVRVHQSQTLGQRRHNCWTHLFAHPDLYRWFVRLKEEGDYCNRKDLWPDFADLSAPEAVR